MNPIKETVFGWAFDCEGHSLSIGWVNSGIIADCLLLFKNIDGECPAQLAETRGDFAMPPTLPAITAAYCMKCPYKVEAGNA